MKKALALTTASGLAVAGLLAGAPAADASTDAESASAWGVKVTPKDSQLRTDFWVTTAAEGQVWDFTLLRVEGEQETVLAEQLGATVQTDEAAQVRFRTWVSTTDVGGLVFRATHNGETCTVTL